MYPTLWLIVFLSQICLPTFQGSVPRTSSSPEPEPWSHPHLSCIRSLTRLYQFGLLNNSWICSLLHTFDAAVQPPSFSPHLSASSQSAKWLCTFSIINPSSESTLPTGKTDPYPPQTIPQGWLLGFCDPAISTLPFPQFTDFMGWTRGPWEGADSIRQLSGVCLPTCLFPGPLDPGKTVLKIVGMENIAPQSLNIWRWGSCLQERFWVLSYS